MKIQAIIDVVAVHFGYSSEDILAKGRRITLAKARRIAMRLARAEGYSLHELGAAFQRDHSSVLQACKRANELIDEDFALCWDAWHTERDRMFPKRAMAFSVLADSADDLTSAMVAG